MCEYLLEYTPAEGLAFRASSGGSCLTGVSSAVYTGTLNTGQWYLVTAWHDSAANTLNLQVNDGSVVSASHAGGVFDGLNEFRLGARADVVSPNYMDGRLDGAGVWKRALTAEERNALWNSSLGCEYHFCAATITYTYDNLYRLTNATYSTGSVFTYTYDAVGNRLTETTITATTIYTYDNANRLTNVGAITYTWDANGNLLTDGTYTNTYDAANRLITTTTGAITYTFAYNGDGARLQQLVNSTPTTYTVDLTAGLTQVLVDVTSGVTNTYLYGNGRIAQDNSSGGTSYFLGDALSSVRQLTNSSGAVALTKSYQPYGSVLSSSGSGASAYGFTGEWTDNTGLVYLRARYYAPGAGRFITRDTWAGDYNNPLTLNAWLYAEGNPVNRVDPSGQCPPETNRWDDCLPLKIDTRDLTSWLHREMTWNAVNSRAVRSMQKRNALSLDYLLRSLAACKNHQFFLAQLWGSQSVAVHGRALATLTWQVKNGGQWDFKDEIGRKLGPGITLCGSSRCFNDVEYSVPGNIFFGYIGRASGFPAAELKWGAAQAERFDPAHRKGSKEYAGPYEGVEDYSSSDSRNWNYGDESHDNAAVTFGIKLWDNYGASMNLSQFKTDLEGSISKLQRRNPDPIPVSYMIAQYWPYPIGFFDNRGKVYVPPPL